MNHAFTFYSPMTRVRKYFYRTRANVFFGRLPLQRIERATALEYIQDGRIQAWSYKKDEILGATVAVSIDYKPKPLRIVGTVMDVYKDESNVNGGIKIFTKYEESNFNMWLPLANPAIKIQLADASGNIEQFLNEQDRWDELYMTGRTTMR